MSDITINEKRFFFVALMFAFAALAIGMVAADTSSADMTDGDWTYTLDASNNATITGYTGTGGDVTIPDTVDSANNYPVVAIGAEAFKNNTVITGCTVPSSLTSIGAGAFQGCTALTAVQLNSNITDIPERMFYKSTNFQYIMGMTTITSVGDYAFAETMGVTGWDFASSDITSIGIKAFYNCTKLEKITLKDDCAIRSQAFVGCPLKEIQFANDTTIVSDAFGRTFYDVDGTTEMTLDEAKGYFFKDDGNGNLVRSSYTVTLDDNMTATVGGSPVTDATRVKANDDIVVTLSNGYEVTAYTGVSPLGDYTYTVSGGSDITFTTDAIEYDIIYYCDSQSIGSEKYTVEAEHTLMEADAVEGYTFLGWFDNEQLIGNPITSIPAGTTGQKFFYAKYEINSHTVTYMIGKEQYGNVETYQYGAAVTVRDKAVITGYTVTDWNKTDFSMPDEDVTIYATKTPIAYTVTLKAEGEHITGFSYSIDGGEKVAYTAPFKADFDSKVKIYLNTEHGYRLDKWSNSSTSNPMEFTVSGDATFSATATDGIHENLSEQDQNIFIILGAIVLFMGIVILILRKH